MLKIFHKPNVVLVFRYLLLAVISYNFNTFLLTYARIVVLNDCYQVSRLRYLAGDCNICSMYLTSIRMRSLHGAVVMSLAL